MSLYGSLHMRLRWASNGARMTICLGSEHPGWSRGNHIWVRDPSLHFVAPRSSLLRSLRFGALAALECTHCASLRIAVIAAHRYTSLAARRCISLCLLCLDWSQDDDTGRDKSRGTDMECVRAAPKEYKALQVMLRGPDRASDEAYGPELGRLST